VIGDRKTYPARVIGADPQSDVAVVKIEARDLPVAVLGNSDEVRVGQWVIAVGNPFQLLHTVTAGIISAKGRSSVGLAEYEDFIQTDASINPGNSGGALADLDGRVIGINTAITSPSGGSIGIGFAIPANMARQIMDQLIAKGKVVRGYAGLLLQDIDENLSRAFKLKGAEGALVGDVVAGGPADRAGIKRGDIIIGFDGQKIENSTQLSNLVARAAPKSAATFTVLRDGRTVEIKVTLEEKPKERGAQTSGREESPGQTGQKLGLSLQDLTPDLADQLGYKGKNGVVIASVVPGSPAEDSGLQPGDLIMEVNRSPVRTVKDFNLAVRGLRSGDVIALLVARGETTFFRALTIQ
jgi:serine protease Do